MGVNPAVASWQGDNYEVTFHYFFHNLWAIFFATSDEKREKMEIFADIEAHNEISTSLLWICGKLFPPFYSGGFIT